MIDLIVVLIILIFARIGYHRGLVRSLLTLGSSVISLIFSFIIAPAINIILKLTPIYTGINEWVSNKIMDISFSGGVQSQGKAIESITWLPSFITEKISANNNSVVYETLGVNNIVDYVSQYITNMIIGMLSLLIAWVLLKFVLVGVLGTMGRIVEKLPVVSTFNNGGGLIVGIAKGLLTVSIIGLIIPFLITNPQIAGIQEMIETSYLAKFLYENNLVIILFERFLG